MRYLGIDYGSAKVGVALSDEAGTMGFPHGILQAAPALVPTLLTLIKNEGVGAVVIGESKDFLGADNAIAPAARELGAQLAEQAGIPVYYEDERLTSAEARRSEVREAKSRKPMSRNAIDASAAALILTSYLSKHHGQA